MFTKVNKFLDSLPRPKFGKTGKSNRMARLIDLNKVVTETNSALTEIEEVLSSNVQYKEVIITSAQILDAHNTPIQLLPAIGEGKYYKNLIITTGEHLGTGYTPGGAGMRFTRLLAGATPLELVWKDLTGKFEVVDGEFGGFIINSFDIRISYPNGYDNTNTALQTNPLMLDANLALISGTQNALIKISYEIASTGSEL